MRILQQPTGGHDDEIVASTNFHTVVLGQELAKCTQIRRDFHFLPAFSQHASPQVDGTAKSLLVIKDKTASHHRKGTNFEVIVLSQFLVDSLQTWMPRREEVVYRLIKKNLIEIDGELTEFA